MKKVASIFLRAEIEPENQRSIRSVCACGFRQDNTDGSMLLYRITVEQYLQLPRDRTVL